MNELRKQICIGIVLLISFWVQQIILNILDWQDEK